MRKQFSVEERQRGRAMTLGQAASRDPECVYKLGQLIAEAKGEPAPKRRKEKRNRPNYIFVKTEDGQSTTIHIPPWALVDDLKLQIDKKNVAKDDKGRRIEFKDMCLMKGHTPGPSFLRETNILREGISIEGSGLLTGSTINVTRREEPVPEGCGLLDIITQGPMFTVCTFLDLRGVVLAGTASKAFQTISKSNDLWHSLCTSRWPNSRHIKVPSFRQYLLARLSPTLVAPAKTDTLDGMTLILDISSKALTGDAKTSLCSEAVPLTEWKNGQISATWNTNWADVKPVVDGTACTSVDALILRQSDGKVFLLRFHDADDSDSNGLTHEYYHYDNPDLAMNQWWNGIDGPSLTPQLHITFREPGSDAPPAPPPPAALWQCAACTYSHQTAPEQQAAACVMCGTARHVQHQPPQPIDAAAAAAAAAAAEVAASTPCAMAANLQFEMICSATGNSSRLSEKTMLIRALKTADWR
jgi:hypothetical protein